VTFKITAVPGAVKAKDGSVRSFTVRKLRAQGCDVREYRIECTAFCGPGHDDMNLKKMIVQ
jgi:heme/copper-type cytochrome/quinol oxidase subunit 2